MEIASAIPVSEVRIVRKTVQITAQERESAYQLESESVVEDSTERTVQGWSLNQEIFQQHARIIVFTEERVKDG